MCVDLFADCKLHVHGLRVLAADRARASMSFAAPRMRGEHSEKYPALRPIDIASRNSSIDMINNSKK